MKQLIPIMTFIVLITHLASCGFVNTTTKGADVDSYGGECYRLEADQSQPAVDYPAHVERAWPRPNSALAIETYNNSGDCLPDVRGISIAVDTLAIDEVKTHNRGILPDRAELYLNGEIVSKESYGYLDELSLLDVMDENGNSMGEMAAGDYELTWFPTLEPGDYVARVVIVSNTGREFEYEWSFELVE